MPAEVLRGQQPMETLATLSPEGKIEGLVPAESRGKAGGSREINILAPLPSNL